MTMDDPVLPAMVESQHHSNNSTTTTPPIHPIIPRGSSEVQAEPHEPQLIAANDLPNLNSGSYLSYVEHLAVNSPILQSVFRPCLNPGKIDIVVLDIKEDWTCLESKVFRDLKLIDMADYTGFPDPDVPRATNFGYAALREFLEKPKPKNVFARLFLVEDLSPAMIEALGSSLNLDPNFFAEQLVGAKYTLDGDGDPVEIRDTESTMPIFWNSRGFISSTWKRRALGDTSLKKTPLKITPSKSYVNTSRQTVGKLNTTKKDRQFNNIVRPFDAIGGYISRKDFMAAAPVAAEEKVTFLQKEDSHGWTGVFLFDPIRMTSKRDHVLYNYNYRKIRQNPSFLDFKSSNHENEHACSPYTRNQFVKYLVEIKSFSKNNRDFELDNIELLTGEKVFLTLLFHFMVGDRNSVLKEMDKFLDSVDISMSDNNMLQKKLETWRTILGSWRKSLIEDSKQVQASLGCIQKWQTSEIKRFEHKFKDILAHIESLKDRTDRTFSALMSSMAIVESQRAITQAESISRLTELAFLFIPLAYATSVFSMQLPGMVENYKPYQWVVLSICLLIGSYGFRIVVRSRVTRHALENIPEKVREETAIPPGAHIPTFEYIVWFVPKMWKLSLLVTVSAVSWALIWTVGHSKSVQIGTTVMVSILFAVGVFMLFRSHTKTRTRDMEKQFMAL